jgi:hypothetical protein
MPLREKWSHHDHSLACRARLWSGFGRLLGERNAGEKKRNKQESRSHATMLGLAVAAG